MNIPKIFESEYKFCLILWENEPISSSELVKLCFKELNWKKSTTYTVIRRLADRGIIENKNSVVKSLASKEDVIIQESKDFLEKNFNGSLPLFISSFTKNKAISKSEIEEIRKMIDEYEES